MRANPCGRSAKITPEPARFGRQGHGARPERGSPGLAENSEGGRPPGSQSEAGDRKVMARKRLWSCDELWGNGHPAVAVGAGPEGPRTHAEVLCGPPSSACLPCYTHGNPTVPGGVHHMRNGKGEAAWPLTHEVIAIDHERDRWPAPPPRRLGAHRLSLARAAGRWDRGAGGVWRTRPGREPACPSSASQQPDLVIAPPHPRPLRNP